MTKDFAHRLRLAEIRDGDRLDLVADEGERAAVAERLGLMSLDRLEAHAVLDKDGATIRAKGRLAARLAQPCVATGEPVEAHVDEPFAVEFRPEPRGQGGDDEIELGEDELDVVFHDGLSIDLGAAIADSLALSLDPYPRSPAAGDALRAAGVISEEEAGPFGALAALKDKLK